MAARHLLLVATLVWVQLLVPVLAESCEEKGGDEFCNNQGTCVDPTSWAGGDPTCNCAPGYSGPTCLDNVAVDPCPDRPDLSCKNGGKCWELVQGEKYKCNCTEKDEVPRFAGLWCEVGPSETCTSESGLELPCFSGSCSKGACVCNQGFSGKYCENPIDDADSLASRRRHGGSSWVSIFFGVVGSVGAVMLILAAYVMYVRHRNMKRNFGRFQELKQVQMQSGPDLYGNDAFDPESPTTGENLARNTNF